MTMDFKNYNDILSDMMTDLAGRDTKITDMNPGSIIRTLIELVAVQLDEGYYLAEQILNLFFAATTSGEYLDLRVAELGLTRAAGSAATGVVTASRSTPAPFSQLVPEGTTFETLDGLVQIMSTEDVTLLSGTMSIDVPVQAVNVGSDGNLQTDIILKQVGVAVSLVELWTVATPGLSGGTNEESDDTLRARYLAQIQLPATSGNASHYMQWALQVTGVGGAKIFPLWDGAGTVKVVIVDTDKQPAETELVTEVAEYIETVRPIGAAVTVNSASGLEINVSATVILAPGAVLADVQDAFEAALEEYLQEIAFEQDYVSYARVGTILLSTDGVLDYSDLQLNSTTANVLLEDEEVPIIGTVSISEPEE